MSSKEGKVAVDLTAEIVGRWKETYQWIPIFGAFATVAMAFSAGANNLTAPVGLLLLFFLCSIFLQQYVRGKQVFCLHRKYSRKHVQLISGSGHKLHELMLFTLIFCTDYKVYWILNLQFSTPVGSGALTLLKASIIACLIYVPGAAFTSKSTVDSLFSDVCKWIFVHKHGQLNTMKCSFFHELIWLCHCSFSKKVNQTQDFWCGAW